MTFSMVEVAQGCRFCPMCRDTCTAGVATALESQTTRGFALLIDHWQRQGALPQGGAEAIYACTQCGLCEATCASRRPLPEAILALRRQLVEQAAEPTAVRQACERFLAAQKSSRDGSHTVDGAVVFDPGGLTGAEAVGIVEALQRLTRASGQNYAVVAGTPGCEHLLADLGYERLAVELAQEHVRQIAAIRPKLVVTACSQCFDMFVRRYPAWGVTWPAGVELQHVAGWLHGLSYASLPVAPAGDGTWFYHDDDCLARKTIMHAEPRALLQTLLPDRWRELPRSGSAALSAGAAGATPELRPDIAFRAAARLLSAATEAAGGEAAPGIVTACARTAAHLAAAARRLDSPVQVLHLAELAVMAKLVAEGSQSERSA